MLGFLPLNIPSSQLNGASHLQLRLTAQSQAPLDPHSQVVGQEGEVLAKLLVLERYAPHSVLFSIFMLSFAQMRGIPSSAEDGTCAVGA